MSVLEQLEPKSVFRFFEELCAVPHGSGNRKPIADWCVRFAQERGLEWHRDGADNVTVVKPATSGYEAAAPIILQGHLDMVCQQTADCAKNMDTEGLDLAVDGDSVYAKGTTLGADNGIAVAMAMALLDAGDLAHPRLEAVFTTDEEIGMLGAADMDVSHLQGRKFLNLDSEDEGVFTVSCAGGNLTRCALPVTRSPFSGATLRVTVGGLLGGHSGIEIHKGRANASVLCGRVLWTMGRQTALRLVSVAGGQKDNAICLQAAAVVTVADASAALAVAADMEAALKNEFRAVDPGLFIRVEPCAAPEAPMDEASTQRIVCLLTCAPNGVQVMSADMEGLVQTSLNLGVLTTEGDTVTASFCVRSAVASQKDMLTARLESLTAQLGGTVEVFGDYPGWEYKPDSALRELLTEVYREQYGEEPKIEAIHAGLECGMFSAKLPGLDCVSIGPDLTGVHTPQERMSIASVQRVWHFVVEVLKRS